MIVLHFGGWRIERLDLGGRASVTVHCIVLARVDFPVTYDNRLRIRV